MELPRTDDGDGNGDGDGDYKEMGEDGDDGGCEPRKCKLNLDKSRQISTICAKSVCARRLFWPAGGWVYRYVGGSRKYGPWGKRKSVSELSRGWTRLSVTVEDPFCFLSSDTDPFATCFSGPISI